MNRQKAEIQKYKRVCISIKDISYAIKLLDHMNMNIVSDIEKYAFEHSFVVTYTRPFSGNDKKNSPKVNDLPSKAISQFSEDEKKLHNRTLRNRNQVTAHSDSKSYGLMTNIIETDGGKIGLPISWRYTSFYSKFDIKTLEQCCSKLYDYLFDEKKRIESTLEPGTYY